MNPSASCSPNPTSPLKIPHLSLPTTSLPHLRRTHALLITTGSILADRFFSNSLITSYSKSGSLPSALQAFDHTPHPDSSTFNSLLSSFALHNLPTPAFLLFRRMLLSSFAPTNLTFTPLLNLASSSLPATLSLHSLTLRLGLHSDTLISNSLIAVYLKHNLIHEARHLFNQMEQNQRDIVLWNVMIKGYTKAGLLQESFAMFSELHRNGMDLRPDRITVACILMRRDRGRESEQVRAYAIKSCLLDADYDDVVAWNRTMSEWVKSGRSGDAFRYFCAMKSSGVEVDDVTFIVLLGGVAGDEFELGKQVHGTALKAGFCSYLSVSNSLINLYARMGSMHCAKKVFDEMEELDLVSWNSMISASVHNGLVVESIALLFDMMKSGVLPDEFTLTSILRACSANLLSSFHIQIHCLTVKMRLLTNSYLMTALIDVYAKNGSMKEAQLLYERMGWFDMVAFNALINGYVMNGDNLLALELFGLLHSEGVRYDDFMLSTILKACSGLVASEQGKQIHAYGMKLGFDLDVCVTSGILDMYIKCGNIEDASTVFMNIIEPDDVAWTTMISGCVDNGDEEYALRLFHRMRQSGFLPDEFSMASLMKACSCLASLGQGKQIHANALKLDLVSDTFVVTSIMDMYAKCGNIEDSYVLFNRMRLKNIASWNAMVLGFAQHGDGMKSLEIFNEMTSKGFQPDKITFIGALSACSHSGLVSEAYRYFDLMLKEYGIKPEVEHYSCLVDALGRAGLLDKAEEVIETMPFNASASMYRALLGACRNRRNTEIGERIATRLLSLEPHDSSAYVLLSNMYASSNQWNAVTDARRSMKRKNVTKDPGYSWIEVRNNVHLFIVNEKSHPEIEAIYTELEDLIRRIKDEGYIPDTDFVLFDVEGEEKERALLYHSEKLAIAYGILKVQAPQAIRVIKNLRVCGDCHSAIKYISKVTGREIVVRDASRFHCFRDGVCSCADYW